MRILSLAHPGTNSRDIYLDAEAGFREAGHDVIRWELEPSQVPERGGHPMRRLAVTAAGVEAARAQQTVLDRFFAGLDLQAQADE